MGYSIRGELLLVLGFPIYLVVLVLSIFKKSKRNIEINWLRESVKFVFMVYILILIGVTLFPINIGFKTYLEFFRLPINLIPFKDVFRQIGTVGTAYNGDTSFHIRLILRNVLGNFILLLPLGVITPVIWRKFTGIKNVLILGFGVSAGIELLQLLEILSGIVDVRIVDIDDVILNVLGVILGYLICEGILYLSNKYEVTFIVNMFGKVTKGEQLVEDN